MSADGRTYTFRIRPGYRFSPPSGAAVTAETFRATIERALSPRLGEESLAALIVDDIVGAAAYHAGRARRVRGLDVQGDRLTIRLVRPAGDLRRAWQCRCSVPSAGHACRTGRQCVAAAVDRAVLHRVAEPGPRGARAQSELPRARPQRPDRIVYLTGVGADEALRRADKGTVDYVPYDYDSRPDVGRRAPRPRVRRDERCGAPRRPALLRQRRAGPRHARAECPATVVPRRRDAPGRQRGARSAHARRGVERARPTATSRPRSCPQPAARATRSRGPTSPRHAGSPPGVAAGRRSTTAASPATSGSPRSFARTCARSASAS